MEILFIQFLPNDQFGSDYDNFTFASNGGGSLAIQINNEHIGDIIFGGGTMPVGTCIYLQREGICYWAKVEEPLGHNIYLTLHQILQNVNNYTNKRIKIFYIKYL